MKKIKFHRPRYYDKHLVKALFRPKQIEIYFRLDEELDAYHCIKSVHLIVNIKPRVSGKRYK